MKYTKYILIFIFAALSISAWGQVNIKNIQRSPNVPGNLSAPSNPPNSLTTPPDSNSTSASQGDTTSKEEMLGGIEYHIDIPDSVLQGSVFIFHQLPLQVKTMNYEHPELSPTGAQFCDQLDGFNGDYYLGVTELGHPHLSTFLTFDGAPSLAYRANIFPEFYKTPVNINFYQTQKPYSVLAYHSSLDKDYQVHVTHTQNVTERWNFAFDYHLFSPTGVFANSSATDHLVDLNTNYYSADARYQIYAGFISQRMTLGENGGLANEDNFIHKRTRNMAGIPMNDTRMSETKDMALFVRQSFNTVRQFEWHRPIKQQVLDTIVTHDTLHIVYYDTVAKDSLTRDSITTATRFELRDTIVGYDTIQPHKPHTYNTGVFALDLQWDKQKYRYTDSTMYNQMSATLYWTNDAYHDYRWHNPLKLFVGIRPQLSWLRLDEAMYNTTMVKQQAIYPFARVQISPWPASELKAFAEAAPNLSEYNLDASLVFPFHDSVGDLIRSISFRAVVKATSPELIYSTQCMRYNHVAPSDFHAVEVRKIEADYRHGSLVDIHLAAQNIGHNIWFEEYTGTDMATIYVPHQTDQNAFLFQGRVNLYLTMWGWLHYDMQQLFQYSTDQEQIRVPLFASKNSFYADFYLFNRALHTQIGADVRYHTAFKADGYDPSLGIFYRQNETTVGNYIWADAFINLQIKRASIYAKAGHVNSLLETEGHLILPQYPSKPFGFFFGMTWKFFD